MIQNNDNDNLDLQIESEIKKLENKGQDSIFKNIDRIHDKLFNLNSIILATYVALLGLNKIENKWLVLFPFFNLCYIIYVDYKALKIGHMEARVRHTDLNLIRKTYRKYTLHSITSIIITLITLLVFLFII